VERLQVIRYYLLKGSGALTKIILASASPRRKEILEKFDIDFEQIVSSADENITHDIGPDLLVKELSVLKARAVAKIHKKDIILSADTIVYADGEILGKPKDEEDAKNMLRKLSGKEHFVYTGYCLLEPLTMKMVSKSVCAVVSFKELSKEIIDTYVKSREPFDKAGAYAIQGKGSVLVKEVKGDYFSVVGLPISDVFDTLIEEFGISLL